MLTSEELQKLATLSRIELSDDEKRTFSGEIDAILQYVSQIQILPSLPGERSLPAVRNVVRKDEDAHAAGAFTEAILAGAPRREGDHIKVKRIL